MGEIDTKSIESVQSALSLFGEKGDHHSIKHAATHDAKERALETVVKDLANYKVQLEAKDSAILQAVLKLQHSQNSVDQLSTLLHNNEIERERYANECRGARTRIGELESEVKVMADLLKARETELSALRELEFKAVARVDVMETKCEEFGRRVAELNDDILVVEKKERENEFAKKGFVDVQEIFENHAFSNSIMVDMLQMQLQEVNHELSLSQERGSNVMCELKLAREELEMRKIKNSSQEALIVTFKMEMNEMRFELERANELASNLHGDVEFLTGDLQKARIEIRMLKSQVLENSRPKIEAQSTSNEIEALDHGNGNVVNTSSEEVERLKKELEIAMSRVGELRNRAEQASCRAEMAEKAKTAIEDQLRKWREERHNKRASIRQVSQPDICTQDQSAYYLPLYKLLNMKF